VIYLKSSAGVEIRGEDLVISCLKSNFSGSVFAGSEVVTGFRTRDREEVRREVARFFKAHNLDRENVALGIPRSEVIVRTLDFPKEVEDNLKQVVRYQVQSYEPTETDKFCYDYLPLKSGTGDKRVRVLLLLVRKSALDGYLATLRELGLRPAIITLGSAAIANMLLGMRTAAGKNLVLTELKPSGIETLLLRDGLLLYTREAEAREGVRWSDLVRQEIDLAVSRARLEPEETIDDIVVAGDAEEPVQREVREALPESRPVSDLMRLEMPLHLRPRLQGAAASIGLAFTGMLRKPRLRMNLLPTELRMRQARWAYIPTVILALLIGAQLVGYGVHSVIQQQTLIRELDREIQLLQPEVERVNRIRTQAEALENRIKFVEGMLQHRDQNLEILLELSNILPNDTYLNIYRNQDGSLQLSGSSSSAPDLIPTLEKSPLLANVVQRGTIFKDAQSGKDRFQFEAKSER